MLETIIASASAPERPVLPVAEPQAYETPRAVKLEDVGRRSRAAS
jgi:hypothetical protein